MKRTTFLLAASFLALACASTANAGISLVYSSGGAASGGATYVNFDAPFPLGSGGPYFDGNQMYTTLTPSAKAVTGSASQYAAPVLSGNNNLNFGTPPSYVYNGADNTQYLTAGSNSPQDGNTGAAITFQFTSLQAYFGLLWGSIDTYNTLTFIRVNPDLSETTMGTFTGTDASASPDGNQGPTGTHYVNINATPGFEFNKVVATSSQYAFELDNVAYKASNFSDPLVPEPASLVVWSVLGIAGFVAYRRRRAA